MEVLRAESLGMCFGVRDALALTADVAEPRDVTILGELVHNEVVHRGLAERGFVQHEEAERGAAVATPRVLVTAHGIGDRTRGRLRAEGLELLDTTCPLVRRAHEAALRLRDDGRFVVIVGRPGHVEVRGLAEDLGEHAIVAAPDDVRRYPSDRLGVVQQTTTLPELAAAIRGRLHAENPTADVLWIDTICQPTRDRQSALARLLERVDGVVVVGGCNSNNTRQLVARCEAAGVPAWHVGGPADLRPEWFHGHTTIGLTAGTSTLDETIEAVEQRLHEFGEATHKGDSPASAAHRPAGPPSRSAHWARVFHENGRHRAPVPWHLGAGLTDEERRDVADSIRIFQLGESGEGRHFLKVAREHAAAVGDPEYVSAVEGLIAEEGRHARDLGRFLNLAGVPHRQRNWTDFVFRRLRHAAGLEACITILLIAEWLAFVYYAALREATGSPLLRAICGRILREEVAHVRFQGERLAILRHERSRFGRWLTAAVTGALYRGTTLVLWWTHRRVFRRAGWSLGKVLRRAGRPAGLLDTFAERPDRTLSHRGVGPTMGQRPPAGTTS